jgi:hypothetical protein
MTNQDRATGRTHRLALKACGLASEGKKVTFIYGLLGEKYHFLQHLRHISAPFGALVNSSRNHLRYPGGGFIELVPANACHEGKRYSIIMMDELLGLNWRQIEKLNEELGHPLITT